ncbi:MAG: glutamate racemase [Streptococcaceae bacterium]|jgi:glutamate racemase|nr:glutamate racemase [Streptococcaceae bacterium]
MDNRPIGFLDSGVGGLTVVRQLFRQLPNEEVVYIGDTKRMPYGSRSPEEILKFTWEMVNFLMSKNVKMICFACNTATAIALDEIQNELGIPVIGVILPGASAAIQKTKTEKIGIIGTQATIESKAYAKAIYFKSNAVKVTSLACPPFVPLVESGDFDNEAAYELVKQQLHPLVGEVDSLILGCTHYPLLAKHIQKVMGTEVNLIDSGAETVRDISVLLNYFKLNRKLSSKQSENRFYTTASAEQFKKIAENWLETSVEVETVSIEDKEGKGEYEEKNSHCNKK